MKKTVLILLLVLIVFSGVVFAQTGEEESGSGSEEGSGSTIKAPHATVPTPPASPTPAVSPETKSPAPAATPTPAKTADATVPAKPATAVEKPSSGNGPLVVKVNMFVRNISKFDPAAGKYNAEFEVEFTAPENSTEYNGKFDLFNGRIIKKEETKSEHPWIKHYKVEAEIDLELDFKRYPLDTQDFSIVLFNPDMDNQELKFEVEALAKDDTRLDNKVKMAGWDIEEDEPTIYEDSFMDEHEKFSMYSFNLELNRLRFAAGLKVFFPLLIMVVISFMALFIGAGAAVNRLTILTGVLLAAVMFHLNTSNALPPIGYLTLADKVFFGVYSDFLLNLICTVAMLKFNEQKLEDKIKGAYSFGLIVVPLFLVIYLGLVFGGIL